MRQFPSNSIPEGWYQIGWSAEFEAGASYPLRYFDRDLVCYRSESGQLIVLDAHCRHMGAHLGYGGIVEGSGIRCPFHGWKFGSNGVNVDIPYSSPNEMGRLKLSCWEVREVDGLALIWFNTSGNPPRWEPKPWVPTDREYWGTYPTSTKCWRNLNLAAQVVVENAADAAHFRFVHTARDVPDVNRYSAENETFSAELNYSFGAGQEKTWATPNGPVEGTLATQCRGLGFIFSCLSGFDRIYNILAVTPISVTTADIRATNYIPRLRGDGTAMSGQVMDRWIRQQHNQVAADILVWENLSFVARPPFAHSEVGPMMAFKKWCRQFYPDAGVQLDHA